MEYLQPLNLYLEARERYRQGSTESAAEALEKAFGSQSPNDFLRRNLDAILDETTQTGQILLDGIYGEMKCIQRETAEPRKKQG